MSKINEITAKLAKKLLISENEADQLIKSSLRSETPEKEVFDLLGEDLLEEASFILTYEEKKKSRKTKQRERQREKEKEGETEYLKFERNTTEVYDEYVINPPQEQAEGANVPVKAINEKFRDVFAEYAWFNKVQSKVFESVYRTEENVLVSAPTGAGKTDIALMSIVKHLEESENRKESPKVVYIAPMKALASEITSKLEKKLPVVVKEHTGDTELEKYEIKESAVLVCTPEKFDVSTRKVSSYLLKCVGLIILDEVHILNDTRGPVIEGVVSRIKTLRNRLQKKVRIIGISATLPNAEDVAEFLEVKKQHLHTFSRAYRPVPIKYSIIGTRKAVDVSAGEYVKRLDAKEKMNYVLKERVESVTKEGHQVIVFVHTRGDTVRVADMIAEEKEIQNTTEDGIIGMFRAIYMKGVLVHHAGLPREVRDAAEQAFKEKRVAVLVSTSTLAWGVNLPARCVVIFGTSFYSPETGTFEDISILDVQQMFGRAGRPQYDTLAEAVLITGHENLAKYARMIRTEDPIESMLMKSLPERMCAEVYMRNIRRKEDAVEWLRSTFLWVRMKRKPEKYGTLLPDVDLAVEDYAVLALERVKALGLADAHLMGTELGRIVSHYSITEKTLLAWNELLKDKKAALFRYLAESSEFSRILVRADDKPGLGLKHEQVEVDREMKIKLLIERHVQRRPVKGYSLNMDQRYVLDNADRLLQGLAEYFIQERAHLLSYKTMYLKKQIERREDRHALLEIDVSVSKEHNSVLFGGYFTGYVYLRHNGEIGHSERVFGVKEYLITHTSMRVEDARRIDDKLVLGSRAELVPVRKFSEHEIWFVDLSMCNIAGYSLVLGGRAALESAGGAERASGSFEDKKWSGTFFLKSTERLFVHALPNVPNEERSELLPLLVYEELKRRRKGGGRTVVVVPSQKKEGETREKLYNTSLIEGFSFLLRPEAPCEYNGIATFSEKDTPRGRSWGVCVCAVRNLKRLASADVYIFAEFTHNGVLYPFDVLQSIPDRSQILIYERENQATYIRKTCRA